MTLFFLKESQTSYNCFNCGFCDNPNEVGNGKGRLAHFWMGS